MPQEQKQPKKQRDLTPQELETAASFTSKWTPEQLRLIWKRKMPPEASMEDFQLFLYICDSKSLNPLLGEVYARLQWSREEAEFRLLVIDGIHGMTKLADSTRELNGIKTTFQEDADGMPVSATTFVWRKGCEQPFEATAYWSEFVGLHEGKPNFFWKSKPRLMLGKCSLALALRLAFAEALAGVFAPEELDHTDTAPEPNSEFAVGELKSEVETEVQRLSPDVAERIISTPESTSESKDSIAQTKERIDAPAMPNTLKQEAKTKNAALVQRLMLDLDIHATQRKPLLEAFYQGWLGVTEMPKDATVFTPALEALSRFSDFTRAARIEFVADAKGLGAKLRSDKEFENATA